MVASIETNTIQDLPPEIFHNLLFSIQDAREYLKLTRVSRRFKAAIYQPEQWTFLLDGFSFDAILLHIQEQRPLFLWFNHLQASAFPVDQLLWAYIKEITQHKEVQYTCESPKTGPGSAVMEVIRFVFMPALLKNLRASPQLMMLLCQQGWLSGMSCYFRGNVPLLLKIRQKSEKSFNKALDLLETIGVYHSDFLKEIRESSNPVIGGDARRLQRECISKLRGDATDRFLQALSEMHRFLQSVSASPPPFMKERTLKAIKKAYAEGADLNVWGKVVSASFDRQSTPLQRIVRWGLDQYLDLLLKYGANPDIQNMKGNTALHIAVLHNRAEAVSSLLKFGAQLDAKNNLGKTPLDMAQLQKNRPDMIAAIQQGSRREVSSRHRPLKDVLRRYHDFKSISRRQHFFAEPCPIDYKSVEDSYQPR